MLRYLHFNVQGAHSLVACAVELAFSRSSGHQNPAPEVGQSHPAQYALPDGAVFPRDAGRSRYACSCTAAARPGIPNRKLPFTIACVRRGLCRHGYTCIHQGLFGRFDHGLGATDEDLLHTGQGQEGVDDRAHLVGINTPLQQIDLLRLARQNVNQRQAVQIAVFEVL